MLSSLELGAETRRYFLFLNFLELFVRSDGQLLSVIADPYIQRQAQDMRGTQALLSNSLGIKYCHLYLSRLNF